VNNELENVRDEKNCDLMSGIVLAFDRKAVEYHGRGVFIV
jgi:hypothetical protein